MTALDGVGIKSSSLVIRTSTIHSNSGNKRSMVMGGTAVERSMASLGSIAIYNVRPVSPSKLSQFIVHQDTQVEYKRHTFYAVHVQNALTGRSWIVYRRYSDFVSLRDMIIEHFSQVETLFPRLKDITTKLYFPRKHKLTSKSRRVVQHRCKSFLEYLVTLHRVVISHSYQMNKRVSEVGQSILRGFLGSSSVREMCHNKIYTFPTPVPRSKLLPSDRDIVNQCGALKTVVEEEDENETADPVQEGRIDSEESGCSDTDSHSTSSSSDDGEDEDMKPSRISTRLNTKKKIIVIHGTNTIQGGLLGVLKRGKA